MDSVGVGKQNKLKSERSPNCMAEPSFICYIRPVRKYMLTIYNLLVSLVIIVVVVVVVVVGGGGGDGGGSVFFVLLLLVVVVVLSVVVVVGVVIVVVFTFNYLYLFIIYLLNYLGTTLLT